MTLLALFLCENIGRRRLMEMFSDEVLEKIFSREDVMKIPLTYQSVMVRAVQGFRPYGRQNVLHRTHDERLR